MNQQQGRQFIEEVLTMFGNIITLKKLLTIILKMYKAKLMVKSLLLRISVTMENIVKNIPAALVPKC